MSGIMPKAVIIGMPGAGKTRVGRQAAHLLGVPFEDSDARIERREHQAIAWIFSHRGEQAFRDVEREVVLHLLDEFDGILALGGGAPAQSDISDALQRYASEGGMVVYLRADPREAMQRAVRSGRRPLLSGGGDQGGRDDAGDAHDARDAHDDAQTHWKRLYHSRKPIYERLATRVVVTHGVPPSAAARRLADALATRRVHVDADRPYDVLIGRGVVDQLPWLLGGGPVRVALIHTDTVQRHSDRARTLMRRAGYEVHELLVPDAEAGKTIPVAASLLGRLADAGFTRSDAVVGLGGGAATDVAGFVAATWMRGIRYVNCPTSLLAMVDASTGGKTGVNIAQGKNLVGSFHTPAGVLADLRTLSSLPTDIFVEGMGEVAKSGFIMDRQILRILERNASRLRHFSGRELNGSRSRGTGADAHADDLEEVIAELIQRTVSVKARYVSADPEEHGLREFLNYGHTLGHAIEQIEHFRWRHGQAVAVGMVFAAELAHILGYIDQDLVDYHRSLLSSLGLRTSWSGGSYQEVLALMHRDKKARGRMLRFVVLEGVGHPVHLEDPPADAVREAFRRIRGERQ